VSTDGQRIQHRVATYNTVCVYSLLTMNTVSFQYDIRKESVFALMD